MNPTTRPLSSRPVSAVQSRRTLLLFVASASLALAQGGYEGAATFKARAILPPALVKGPHFQVKEDVPTTGYFHDFAITSDYGDMGAEGRSLLRKRVHEIEALTQLDEVSKSEVFLKAAGNSVLNVGKGVASVVADPEATAKGIGGGVKRFGSNLGRKAKRGTEDATDAAKGDGSTSSAEPQKSSGDKAADAGTGAAKSVLGVNSAMRRWAQKLQVDPYTSNEVLRKALDDIAQIDAAGGIAAKVVVPVPMIVGTTASVGGLVWGKDPEALLKLNEQRVARARHAREGSTRVLQEQGLQAGLPDALHRRALRGQGQGLRQLRGHGRGGAERAAGGVLHGERRAAAALPREDAGERDPARLAGAGGEDADGRAVILLAVDYIRWSEAFEKSLKEILGRAKSELGASRVELHMTGFASAGAKQQLKALGVTLVEKVPGLFPEPKATAAAKAS